MKFSLAFLVVLGLSGVAKISGGPIRSSSDLHEVFEEFLALVPKEKVVQIFFEYLENDAEVQHVMEYMESDEFKELVKKVESIEDVVNFYDYLTESGLDIYGLVNKLHAFIGLPPLVPGELYASRKITGGVAGLFEDIMAILPIDEIKALYHEKLETTPAFAELVERLSSPRFQELIDALRANEEFRKIAEYFQEAGINMEAIKDLLTALFGLEFPEARAFAASSLHRDLTHFLQLLPLEEMKAIAFDYLENDPLIEETIDYLESPEFHRSFQRIEAMPEAQNVLTFLQESGLDARGILNALHHDLGIPSNQQSQLAGRQFSRVSGGMPALIADFKAILPINVITIVHRQKLENSPDFARFVKRVKSSRFLEIVEAVRSNKEARAIISEFKSHGLDLGLLADLFADIFGLRSSESATILASNELRQDFLDFFSLLPLDKIIDVSIDFLFNDPEVRKAAGYLKSREFKELATSAQHNMEFRTFVYYLEESGLDAFEYINQLNRYLAIPEILPPESLIRSMTSRGGVRAMLDAIEALLPRDEIAKMYEEKLKTSGAFSYFVHRLEAPEFQSVVDKLVLNKDFQKLGHRAADFGIDIVAIADFMSRVLGIEVSEA